MKRTKTTVNRTLVIRPKYIAKIRRERLEVPEDPTPELMGMFGKSYKAMQRKTGLSYYQIAKRLKAQGIKVRDYRDSMTTLSQEIDFKIDYLAEKRIINHIERYALK